jgi:Kef-type K+ transport system membrane component KefB
VLGLVEVDAAVEVLALLGLAMLLFLAGLEIDLAALRGPVLRLALASFVLSFALGLAAGLALRAAGEVRSAVFVAVVLSATSLGVVIPVLKDAGASGAPLGRIVIAAASVADIATILLLSLLFSEEGGSVASTVALLGGFVALAVAVVVSVQGAERSSVLSGALLRLQDTTAQIRVRGAVLLLVVFAAAAQELGLEVILGAFVAGALLGVLDRDRAMSHPNLRPKLDAVGFGLLVPVFFVTSGLRFDLDALTEDPGTLARVPILLVALLAVRGLPALLYRGTLGSGRAVAAAGLLQATSLPFIVAATAIGAELEVLGPDTAAGLVAAGLLSLLLFPAGALTLLRRGGGTAPSWAP